MRENPYTYDYLKVVNLADLTDEEIDESLIEFTLSYIRNAKEYEEEEDTGYNIAKELSEHNPDAFLEYINRHRTWGFDEDFKDYLVRKYYYKFEDF